MTPDSERLLRNGRTLLFAQFAYLLLSTIGLFLWQVRGEPSRGDFTDVLRFAFELGLFFAVWRGWRWAKWLMIGLCAAAAVAAAFIAQAGVRPEELRVVVIALAMFYGWIAVSLVSSCSINAFLNRHARSDAERG